MGYGHIPPSFETVADTTQDLVAHTKLARTQRNGTRTNGPSFGKEEERRQAAEAEGG